MKPAKKKMRPKSTLFIHRGSGGVAALLHIAIRFKLFPSIAVPVAVL